MKYLLACLVVLFTAGASFAYAPGCGVATSCTLHHDVTFSDRWNVAETLFSVNTPSIDSTPNTTVTVKGGDLAASVIQWLQVVFGTMLAGFGTLLIVKIRAYFGMITTDAQKAALQAIAVNGVNAGAAKAEEALKTNPNLSFDVKSAVAQDALAYTQTHGAEIIKSLGLDPNDGDAIEALKARVATAMNSPETPTITATSITPPVVA